VADSEVIEYVALNDCQDVPPSLIVLFAEQFQRSLPVAASPQSLNPAGLSCLNLFQSNAEHK
jgi:hypothetical protein